MQSAIWLTSKMVDWNIAALVGVPGVGKTSLSRSAARALGYSYVNYGELMLEVAMSSNLASNQEEMFKLESDVQHSIWKGAAIKIEKMKNFSMKILIDLHGVDQSDIGYIISLPIEIISPELIVVVESSYEDIIMRRHSDESRIRSIENMKSVKEHMEILRVTMLAYSVIYGSYITFLDNYDFEKSLKELKEILC